MQAFMPILLDAPNEIAGVRFEFCPYEYVLFRNLSLHPGQRTQVQIEYIGIEDDEARLVPVRLQRSEPGGTAERTEQGNAETGNDASGSTSFDNSAHKHDQAARPKDQAILRARIGPLDTEIDDGGPVFCWRVTEPEGASVIDGWYTIVEGVAPASTVGAGEARHGRGGAEVYF